MLICVCGIVVDGNEIKIYHHLSMIYYDIIQLYITVIIERCFKIDSTKFNILQQQLKAIITILYLS